MSVVDFGDYTVTTTVTANGQTEQITYKPGTAGDNQQQLAAKAAAALSNNQAFLAIATPTNAQAVAQVQALTRQMNALIRLVSGMFDTTAGT